MTTNLKPASKLAHDLHPELSGQTTLAQTDDGTLVNMAADPNDPATIWLDMLAGDDDFVARASGGGRELNIGDRSPDEKCVDILVTAYRNGGKHIHREVLVEGTHFHLGGKTSLDSTAKRIQRQLCNEDKRGENALTMGMLQLTQIKKGSVVGKRDGVEIKAPTNAIRLTYQLTTADFERMETAHKAEIIAEVETAETAKA